MIVLGLIPARGGSKAIPGKNLAQVAGRSLLAWTLDAALGSRGLTRVIVSTDDEQIAAEARRLGAEVPFMRPAGLAGDETPMLDVVLHACEEASCDVVVLLQPTSPLRRTSHIDEALELFQASGADCVVSVTAVPHRFAPGSLMELREGRLAPLDAAEPTRRQEKAVLYARNGPAVLVNRLGAVEREHTLYPADTRPYPMADYDSVDVDVPFDLEIADLLLRTRGKA